MRRIWGWGSRFRKYRLAMPSALVGLVAFSFTLLFFGSAVYTAALPSMVAIARQDAELTPEQVQAAVTAAQTSLGESPRDAPEMSDSRGAASTASGGAAKAGLGGLSGLSGLSGVLLSPSTDPRTAQLTPTVQATTAATTTGATNPRPTSPGMPSHPETSGPVSPETSEPDNPQPSEPDDPNAEAEQAAHDTLVSYANKLQGYTGEVQACVASFEADALTQGVERRAANQRVVESLGTRIFKDFEGLVNRTSLPEGSKWTDARDNLIGAYRTLMEYLDCYDTAWTLNLAFDNPADHVDEFMEPINADAPGCLAEFNGYCSKVVL